MASSGNALAGVATSFTERALNEVVPCGLQTDVLVQLERHTLFHRDPCACLVSLTLSERVRINTGLCSRVTKFPPSHQLYVLKY